MFHSNEEIYYCYLKILSIHKTQNKDTQSIGRILKILSQEYYYITLFVLRLVPIRDRHQVKESKKNKKSHILN